MNYRVLKHRHAQLHMNKVLAFFMEKSPYFIGNFDHIILFPIEIKFGFWFLLFKKKYSDGGSMALWIIKNKICLTFFFIYFASKWPKKGFLGHLEAKYLYIFFNYQKYIFNDPKGIEPPSEYIFLEK